MSFKHITSRDNAIFKHLKKIADNKRERNKEGKTLLDGVHLIAGYLQAFGELELLIIPEGKSSQEAVALMQDLADVNTTMFPTLLFAELTPVASSTGILALVKLPTVAVPEKVDFALMLEDIQDPGNLGSMLRTALGAGVDAVYLSKGCTDAWSPKCLRGGQGAQFQLAIVESVDIVESIEGFAGSSYATTLSGDSIYTKDLTQSTAFVIGNEGGGLTNGVINAATAQVSIPMSAGLESLNAAAAAAVCLFERQRQAT
ncbi:MAG: TrmH family RNA methyltransferase [Methylophilaceae bacterium]|jgi:TrmH family RNA methyltransferase